MDEIRWSNSSSISIRGGWYSDASEPQNRKFQNLKRVSFTWTTGLHKLSQPFSSLTMNWEEKVRKINSKGGEEGDSHPRVFRKGERKKFTSTVICRPTARAKHKCPSTFFFSMNDTDGTDHS